MIQSAVHLQDVDFISNLDFPWEELNGREALCQAYGSQYGVDFIIPRFSRLFGPTMRLNDTKAMSQFIFVGARGQPIVLKSAGNQLYSYCYSADAVSGMLTVFFKGERGKAYNIAGSGCDVTLREAAEIVSASIKGLTGS